MGIAKAALSVMCNVSSNVANLNSHTNRQVVAWSGCQNLWPPQWTDGSDCEGWFMAVTREGTKAAHSLTTLSLWCIWKQRNAVVFRESRRTAHAVSMEVKDVCSLWSMAGGRFLRPLLDRDLFF